MGAMEEIAGVAVVPLIVGLVEVAKGLGLAARWAPTLAVGLGLLVSLGYRAALGAEMGGTPLVTAWAEAALSGLALGLAASGLYSGARAVVSPRLSVVGDQSTTRRADR